MEVGSAQSQSLLAAVTTTTQLKAAKLTSAEGEATSVLLSISKQVDTVYTQRVLDDSLAESFNAAFQQGGNGHDGRVAARQRDGFLSRGDGEPHREFRRRFLRFIPGQQFRGRTPGDVASTGLVPSPGVVLADFVRPKIVPC